MVRKSKKMPKMPKMPNSFVKNVISDVINKVIGIFIYLQISI